MGFIDTSNDPKVPVFYNVVHAVGLQCPNPRDDVKLVQYLLLAFYDKALASSSVYTRPNGNLTVDGSCGPITNNWILKFQLDVNKRYPNTVMEDSRMDRVRNKDLIGSISGTVYTLAILNRFVQAINPDAWALVPALIPLDNQESVPPPSNDVVGDGESTIVPD
ncbi:MAG TPA: hypothetical protein VK612_00475, partial [Pyrinomonadaceae bacterium]|nr:hypothetical protein [Pyrinomonadaceae bacterium]